MNKKKIIEYIVIIGVMIIPFMYSFFYLKAYWNPYGKGNIDNLPVAVVNNDTGDMGEKLINNIRDSKKLKLSIVSSDEAEKGLNNGKYYAVINIPSDFTDCTKSISTTEKKHPTITYSPNQKSNYLSSQIINTVMNVVEKSLDNTINSTIVGSLVEKITDVPDQLETISEGFTKIENGTNKIYNGSKEVTDGLDKLNKNYNTFDKGISDLNSGIQELDDKTDSLNSIGSSITTLVSGVKTLKNGSDQFTGSLNTYVSGVNTTLDYNKVMANYILSHDCANVTSQEQGQVCAVAKGMVTPSSQYGGVDVNTYLKSSGSKIKEGNATINSGITSLNSNVQQLPTVVSGLNEMKAGIKKLADGSATLDKSSKEVKTGINKLYNGSNTLTNGAKELDSSVRSAHKELDKKIDNTREETKKLDGLEDYSKEPVIVKTEPVNEVDSYGTAFAPLFISIALWVGSLMMYVVLYFDKHHRFGILDEDAKGNVKRTLTYHLLATASGLLLAILLQMFLDIHITNIFLYYFVLILVSNTFLAIMQFLIGNFKDVGKFLALIILVLQLAASGGTFPIETVTKGFRWLNNILPMSYTIRLVKETIMTIEGSLLTKNLIIVILIFIVFFVINLVLDIRRDKKNA